MLRKINAKLLAGVIALGFLALPPPPPAQAALSVDVRVGFNDFYVALRPYGRWIHHPRWGDVWLPQVADFHPYRNGHWEYTDVYGWLWESDYVWGDVPFHYGRWVYDPADGWLWVPGYIWAPAWVLWRSGDGYLGWAPMPPDNAFLAGEEIYPAQFDFDREYVNWYGPNYGPDWFATSWVFVNPAHFADRDYGRYAVVGGAQAVRIFNQTRNVTRYATQNNYVVNRSVDPAVIGQARGRPVTPVPLRQAIRANAPVAPIDVGRDVQQTERRTHGGNAQAPATARAEPFNPAAAGRGNERGAPPAQANAVPAPPNARERGNRANREFAQPGSGQIPGAAERGPRQREAIAPPENRGREARLPPASQAAPAPFQSPPAGRERPGREARLPPAPPPGPPAFQGGPPPGFEGPPPGFAAGPRQRGEGGSGRRAPFEAPPAGAPAAPPPQFALGGRRGGGGPPPGFAPNASGPPQGHGGPPPAPPANAAPPNGGGPPGHGGGGGDQGGGHGRGHDHQ